MAAITPKAIMELRSRTNAGMMDCKKALTETNGDMEEAIKVLRERGQAIMLKRADKETKQGLVASASADGAVSLVEVNCETDFVANTDGFKGFVKKVAEGVAAGDLNIAETLKDDLSSLTASTGESTKINRVERFTVSGVGTIGTYIHGGKLGVIVEVGCEKAETAASKDFADLAHDLAIQLATMGARWVDRSQVPQDVIDSETEVNAKKLEEDQKAKGGKPKPAEILKKIAAGQMNKFYAEHCLVEQSYFRNGPGEKTTVTQVIDAANKKLGDKVVVRRYVRFQLGA